MRAISVRSDFRALVFLVMLRRTVHIPSSGPALRRERRALGLSAGDVARHYGAGEPRVRALEQQLHVQAGTADRYIAAIEQAQRERERRATAEARERAERAGAGLTA